jgi:predicted methyltransferase
MLDRQAVLLVAVAALLVGCGGGRDEPVEPAAVDAWPVVADIEPAVDDPLRPEEDRARDADRRPAEVLAFFGIGEGMRVADLQATLGYYTEILSSVVGPEGRVYAQNNNFVLENFAAQGLADRLAKLQDEGRANVIRVDAELDEMELPPDLDAVLFVRFYHDLFWLPTPDGNLNDRPEFLRRVYLALKPGGVFGVVDHHAEAGSEERDALDPEKGLHRIDVELVKREILAAGFVLDAESDVLANPDDTRDWNIFIDERTRRDTTDRFVLRFVKPEA